jgi:hypothetical protein
MNPPPTDEQVAQRHYDFGQAFLIRKNLTEAFTYIDSTYIVGPTPLLVLGT